MEYLTVLFAVLPALVLAQDGGGSPNPLESIADNPAISAASASASSSASGASASASPSGSEGNSTALPTPVIKEGEPAAGTIAPHSGSGASPTSAISPSGTAGLNGNGTASGGNNGTNGTNSTGGAEHVANTVPIAAWLAAAGAVGAMVL